MNEPALDKIRRAAELAMREAAAGNDHLAYLYAAWIREHIRDLLYEDLYQPPPRPTETPSAPHHPAPAAPAAAR